MSQVIACPNCDKKLALSEELKGRALICPQCKGRFTVPADEPPAATFGTTADRAPSGCGSGMDFLDNLGSAPGRAAAKTAAKTATPVRPASARPATGKAAASPASRAAASRVKKIDPMMLYIGGGVAAAVLVVIVVVCVVMSSKGGGNGGTKQAGKVIFGMSDASRHQLFNEMFVAVDQYGISKECKEEWFRLADNYKLDRKNLKSILDEGFSRADWVQPAPSHVTNKTRGTRMEWIGQRHNGGDPILAL